MPVGQRKTASTNSVTNNIPVPMRKAISRNCTSLPPIYQFSQEKHSPFENRIVSSLYISTKFTELMYINTNKEDNKSQNMCKKRETLLYKVSLDFNDLFFTKFKYIEFRRVCHRQYHRQGLSVELEVVGLGAQEVAAVVAAVEVIDIDLVDSIDVGLNYHLGCPAFSFRYK